MYYLQKIHQKFNSGIDQSVRTIRHIGLLLPVIIVTGCAVAPSNPSAGTSGIDQAVTEDVPQEEVQAPVEEDPNVPNLALDSDSLYNILLSDIALHYGHTDTGLEAAIAVAESVII